MFPVFPMFSSFFFFKKDPFSQISEFAILLWLFCFLGPQYLISYIWKWQGNHVGIFFSNMGGNLYISTKAISMMYYSFFVEIGGKYVTPIAYQSTVLLWKGFQCTYTETEIGSILLPKKTIFIDQIFILVSFNSKRSGRIPTYKIKACIYLTLLHIA